MNNEIYITQILDDYLDGLTTFEETEALLAAQSVDNCSETITLHKAAVIALQRNAVIAQVKKQHAQFMASYQPKSIPLASTTSRTPKAKIIPMAAFRWTLRIAAMLLVVLGGWFAFEFNKTSSNTLYAEIYQPYRVNTDRAATDDVVPHNLIKLYKENNYTAVIKTYQTLKTTNNREKFFTAMAFHETGEYQNAINLLAQILADNRLQGSRIYNDEAEFFTGLSYLKMKDGKAALPWLQQIYADPNHTFHDRITKWTITRLKWLQ